MTATEATISGLWADVLGSSPASPDQDFFALGGDSLAAAMLVELVESEFAVELPPEVAADLTTVRALAGHVAAAGDRLFDLLVTIQQSGSKVPLFVVHNGYGHHVFAKRLGLHLGDDQPVYALRLPGVGANKRTEGSLSELAARYISAMKQVQESGPYMLFGDCLGGLVAFEMALQLRNAGEVVGLLAAFDVVAPSLIPTVDLVERAGLSDAPPPRYVSRVAHTLVEVRRAGPRKGAARLANLTRRESTRAGSMVRWRFSGTERRRRRNERASRPHMEILFNRFASHVASYVPTGRFDGTTLLILTEDRLFWGLQQEDDLGWSHDVAGEVRVVRVDCAHSSEAATEPFIAEIAEAIRVALDAVEVG
jgi:thioesterase domain-containing protein/acyl carrier protein